MARPTRVLIVDDSVIAIQTIRRVFEADPSIEVVGHATDGARALDAVAELQPDVVTMDINMPEMDGIEATRRIVSQHGTPIVIVSAYASANSVAIQTMRALMNGAIESVQKPSNELGLDLEMVGAELVAKVKAASRARPPSLSRATSPPPRPSTVPPGPGDSWRAMPRGTARLVCIGVSTGGPSTLKQIVPAIPAGYPLPVALVIHMPSMFIPILAADLTAMSQVTVGVAADGEALRPGHISICPAGVHMRLSRDLRVRLAEGAPVNGCLPAVDVLFESVASDVTARTLGIVLTGMGRDGAKGLAAMKDRGHLTAAQDEATSVVYGMPRAAMASGAASYEVSLRNVVPLLERAAGRD